MGDDAPDTLRTNRRDSGTDNLRPRAGAMTYMSSQNVTPRDDTGLNIAQDAPWLAPLAGYSDLAFRLLSREFGAQVVCSEMVSAKGLHYKSSGTEQLLETTPEDDPMVLQLFGNDTDIMASAMEPLVAAGYRWFDLNMGCSVRKVVKTGCGAAMLCDVPNAVKVAQTMVRLAGAGRVGFKFRLGWEAGSEVYLDLARRLQDVGAGWVSLHPRFARQGFSGEARWSALRELVEAVDIPVIASGDLFHAEDGVRCVRETGVAGVMFARGALNNPAIFEEYATLLHGGTVIRPDPVKTMNILRRHVALARQHCPDKTALFKMRSLVPRYVKLFPGAKHMRNRLTECTTWERLDELLEEFFTRWQADGAAFVPEHISLAAD